jgi:uncharacterized protein YqhQ
MDIFNVNQNTFHHRVGSFFNYILSVVGFIIFLAFMFALLTCPFWLPSLVDKIH